MVRFKSRCVVKPLGKIQHIQLPFILTGIQQVIEVDGPDRLPGEVLINYSDYSQGGYEYHYDPEPTVVELNMNYDKLNDPEEVKTLFDPYEELEKEAEDNTEDTMIIPHDVIMEANRQTPESFYENDESYDTMESYYATHNRKRRHKSLQHYLKKTMSDSQKGSSKLKSSSTFRSTPNSSSKKVTDIKHKGRSRLQDYFGGSAIT